MVREIKDPVVQFLETVTYDEVMAYQYLLYLNLSIDRAWDPDVVKAGQKTFNNYDRVATDFYGWTDDRKRQLSYLTNWHSLNVPTWDWRINYFLSLGRDIPEETLVEQYAELKTQGDAMHALRDNGLRYGHRAEEIERTLNTIIAVYAMITQSLPLGEFINPSDEIVWADSQVFGVDFLQVLVSEKLSKALVTYPTLDLVDKLNKYGPFNFGFNLRNLFETGGRAIFGPVGVIVIDRNKPTTDGTSKMH